MSANVQTMAFVGETPWHGEGVSVTDPAIMRNSQAFCKEAGMDWDVETVPLYTAAQLKSRSRSVVRMVDGKQVELGVVGPQWKPLQNRDAFSFFQPWLDAGLADLHTGGALFDGEKVWVLARLALDNVEIVAGDEIVPYVLLSNAHDGKNAVRVGFTPIRVVCKNTLAAAHNAAASKLIRVRHNSKIETNLETLRDTMDLVKQEFVANCDQYKILASRHFNQQDVIKYVKTLLGVEETPQQELPTRTANTIENIFKKIFGGKGQDNPKVNGTWWAAYNGFNEVLNWEAGRNTQNRLENLWFGQGLKKNADALALALELAA